MRVVSTSGSRKNLEANSSFCVQCDSCVGFYPFWPTRVASATGPRKILEANCYFSCSEMLQPCYKDEKLYIIYNFYKTQSILIFQPKKNQAFEDLNQKHLSNTL